MFTPKPDTSTYRLTRRLAFACFAVAALSLAGLLFLAVKVSAQGAPPCMPRQQMVEYLAKEFGEHQLGAGVLAPPMIVEFFLSPKGTWTILQSFLDGRPSCVVMGGSNWRMRPRPEEREA